MNEQLFGQTVKKIFDDITGSAAADCNLKRDNANINGDTAMGAIAGGEYVTIEDGIHALKIGSRIFVNDWGNEFTVFGVSEKFRGSSSARNVQRRS